MTTFGNTQRKIRTVMMRSGRDFNCQDKPLMDINRSMLLQAKVSDVILNRPVRFPVAGKFQWLSIFINFAFRRFTLVFFFFQSFIAERGRSRLNQPGINGNTFIYGYPLDVNCLRTSELILAIASFDRRLRNRLKVE